MIAVDLGVVACAANRFAPQHARAAAVLEALVNGDQPWALPWPVVHEFIRLVTHPTGWHGRSSRAAAAAFVDRLLQSPAVRPLGPTPAHGRTVSEVLESSSAAGGLPEGFETAVLLREHGVRELLSADRGMRRFAFLTVIDPFHGEPWAPDAPPLARYRSLRVRPSR
jgi:predicted nucleic acid-binding protein